MIAIAKAHVWNCMIVLPKDPDKGRTYNQNVAIVVCASTIAEAVQMIMLAHADATIYGMSHVRETMILIDSALLPA